MHNTTLARRLDAQVYIYEELQTLHTHILKSFHLITCVTRILSIYLNLSQFCLCVHRAEPSVRPVIRHLKYAVFKVTHKILIQSGVEEIKVELGCGSMGQCLPCTYEALSLSPGLEHWCEEKKYKYYR